MNDTTKLDGLKVLVIEDETIVAMLLEQMLEELNCEVAGVAGQVTAATELARSIDVDVAILDMNLAGQKVDPVARALAERQVPFVFASGYGEDGLTPEWRGRPVLPKPFRLDQLRDALAAATAERGR
jgi:CheY-like chemotaxis protein